MPFTPSHAVVALPFLRTPLVPAAIAIGAMTPDLPLFIRGFGVDYSFTHTYANVVFTAVIALGLFLLWRVVLRPAAAELSPAWLASRLPIGWNTPAAEALNEALGIGQRWTRPLWLAVSLLLGVTSHIVWDAFTHEGRAGVGFLPVLAEQWGPLPVYRWLQHGSSILGLVILAVWALVWLRRTPARTSIVERTTRPWVRVAWWVSLPVLLIAAWVAGYVLLGPFDAGFTVQHLAYRALPLACGVWGMLTLALCVALPILGRRLPRGAAPRG